MADKTGIEWTDATWNPIRGCRRVSTGCINCYAETMAARFSGPGQPYEGLAEMKHGKPRWTGQYQIVWDKFDQPLRWKRPRMIFVNSMSDLFYEELPFSVTLQIFETMIEANHHIFQVLTKRPGQMLKFFKYLYDVRIMVWNRYIESNNIWMGISAENQDTANERIPLLLKTPGHIRWVSAEPLLGPIDLRKCGAIKEKWNIVRTDVSCSVGEIDWLVTGGESGHGARPMHPNWARKLRDDCSEASIPFFFKQWGKWSPDMPSQPYNYRKELVRDGVKTTTVMYGVGKKIAGNKLDSKIYQEYPK